MAEIFLSSLNQSAGRDGSKDNPYNSPAELPTPWTLEGGNDYRLQEDSWWNFSQAWILPAYTASAITVTAYGSGRGRKPVIECYRLCDRSECAEVAITQINPTTTTPASGTRLWRVPVKFFGLFGSGRRYGIACDVAGTAGDGGSRIPAAPYEYSVASTDGGLYRLVYSDGGNPVDVYGALFVNAIPDADTGTAYKNCAIGALQAFGGLYIAGLKFGAVGNAAIFFAAGNPALNIARMKRNSVQSCEFDSCYRAIGYSGTGTKYNGKGFSGNRVIDNVARNLARTFVDRSYGECCFNDDLIARNVVNGFCLSYSSGGIYAGGAYTTDGSKMTVEYNSLYGGRAGRVWVSGDGYAIYQENSTEQMLSQNNLVWGCDSCFNNNVAGPGNVQQHNVAISKGVGNFEVATYNRMFTGNCSAALNGDVLYLGNIGIGFDHFISSGTFGVNGLARVLGNLSIGSRFTGGTLPSSAVNGGAHDTSKVVLDGNCFLGHDQTWIDYHTGSTDYGQSNAVQHGNIEELIAQLPVPSNPEVNYALQISPNFWGSVVNLR